MAAEPYWLWMYADPPLAGGPDRLRGYIEDMRAIAVPDDHPQAEAIRDDIALAERALKEIEQEDRADDAAAA